MPDYVTDKAHYDGDPLVHKQLYEFARDVIRVTNPTNRPFKWKFDGRWFTMQPGEIKDKERYWTDHYAKTLAEAVIGDLIIKQGEEAITRQASTNSDILYDKYIESMRIWNRLPRKDDAALLRKIMKGIVLGCVAKYGADEAEFGVDEPVVAGQLRDKSFEQQLLEELSNRPLLPQQPVAPVSDRVIAAEGDAIPQPVAPLAPQQPTSETQPVMQPFNPPPMPTQQPYDVQSPVAREKVPTSLSEPTPPPAAAPTGNGFSLPQTISTRDLEAEATQ